MNNENQSMEFYNKLLEEYPKLRNIKTPKPFLLKLDAETHQKLKMKAVQYGISMQNLVNKLIQDALQ